MSIYHVMFPQEPTCLDKFKHALCKLNEGECLYTKLLGINILKLYKYIKEGNMYLCHDYEDGNAFHHNFQETLNMLGSQEEIITEEEFNVLLMMKELKK